MKIEARKDEIKAVTMYRVKAIAKLKDVRIAVERNRRRLDTGYLRGWSECLDEIVRMFE